MKDFRMARSWLFVPGNSERKLAACWTSGADAVIVDLEDSVPAEEKAAARLAAAAAIRAARERGHRRPIVLRANALQTGLADDDVAATIDAGLDGYVVPKVAGAADVVAFAGLIDRHAGGRRPEIGLIPIATELPRAIFHLPDIATAHRRVGGLFWGMEDLGVELGARRTRRGDGEILDAFKTVRSLALFAAAAAGIACVDTPVVDMANTACLAREAEEASWMGFSGKLAIHPAQLAVINAAFTPSAEEIEDARAILKLSADGGGAAFRYKGRMVDTPHLTAAAKLLAKLDAIS